MLLKIFTLLSGTLLLLLGGAAFQTEPPPSDPDSLRNLGRCHYEEENYPDALKSFEQLLKVLPDSAIDEINLGIVLVQMERYEEARTHLARGEKLNPSLAPYAAYNRALSYKRERRLPEAVAEFERMRSLDPTCPDTAYNLAVVYENSGDLPKAFDEATRAVELLPDQIAPHYRRMMLAVRLGKLDVANLEKQVLSELRAVDSRSRTPAELERSMYTEIPEPSRTHEVTRAPQTGQPSVRFEEVTTQMGVASAAVTQRTLGRQILSWADGNGDGRAEIFLVLDAPERGPQWWSYTGVQGFTAVLEPKEVVSHPWTAAAWGDLDHDGDNDLCVSDREGITVFLNEGSGKYPSAQLLPAGGTAGCEDLQLIDFDHDGDLDLYTAPRSEPPVMYRNDGKGNLASVPEQTGLSGRGVPVLRICPLDFDEDNDTDFLLLSQGQACQLLSNLRLGKFQDVAGRLGLDQAFDARNAAIADVNNDSWPDILILQDSGEIVAFLGRRLGRFERRSLGRTPGPGASLAVLDFDNDGDEDIIAGGRLFQNDAEFQDVTAAVGLASGAMDDAVQVAAEDFDQDGDLDLAACRGDGRLVLWRNQGGNRNHWIRVNLEGLQSNRFGVGTKVEVRHGSFFQRKIATGLPLLFGLGQRASLDVLRMWWPTGVAQNILAPRLREATNVREKLGPPSSCPFVYVWDGKGFSFLTDALDTAALGVPLGTGGFLPYASKEDVLIPGSRMQLRNGQVVIQITGELRELVYLDAARLSVVDSPAGVEVFPDEAGGKTPTVHSRLHGVTALRPPIRALDRHGRDLAKSIAAADHTYTGGLVLTRFHGLAENHTLELDFGRLPPLQSPTLVLTGWINWIDGDTLYALDQGAGPQPFGPTLEVQREDGSWSLISDNIGVPAGIDKTILTPLPSEPCQARLRLRLTTNLEIYWDRIALAQLVEPADVRLHTLEPAEAHLHFRGFSEIVFNSDGKPPWYDYQKVATTAAWRPQQGWLTRYGDVSPLLTAADDRLTVFGPGDELTLVFRVPVEFQSGRKRDYVLRLDGWIKDANPTTFTGNRVDPLPFRGMGGYPFGAETGLLNDPSYGEYLSRYNTRALK